MIATALLACSLMAKELVVEPEEFRSVCKTIQVMKRSSFVRMMSVIGENSLLDIEKSGVAVALLCKYSHTSPDRDPVKFSWENIDAMRKEAQERRDQAVIDSLKVIEEALHLKPGHAIEEGREAYLEFKEAYEGYRMAQMMEGYLERGQYQKWKNGVFLGALE